MSNISDIKLQNQAAFSLFERNQADIQLSQVAEEFESLFVSIAHSDEDLEKTSKAFCRAVLDLNKESN